MEEVDKILIHALRQSGTGVAEDIQSVKQFTSELIVEAVVRCVRVINPALGGGLSPSLPPGMSARFRVGMGLAQACQDLGYKGEIGYQTFLYSNEPEIRALLMFLVEKLPRESAEASDQPAGKSVVLQRAIAAKIKAQLALPWLPHNCRLPLLCKTQVTLLNQQNAFHFLLVFSLKIISTFFLFSRSRQSASREYQRDVLLPVTAQPPHRGALVASLLEQHTAELSAAQEWDSEWNSQGLLSRLTPEEYRSRKAARLQKRIQEQLSSAPGTPSPGSGGAGSGGAGSDLAQLLLSFQGAGPGDLLPKGTHFTHTQKFTFTQVTLMTLTLTQVTHELKERERANQEKEDSLQVKRQTVELLPDAHNNLAKLQTLVEASAKRLVGLAAQWEKHRDPLIQEHRRLKELCTNQDVSHPPVESSRQLSEIKDLHEKIRETAEKAKKKESVYKQLISELENLPKDVSRSAYTLRILEIVGNIKKQKEEITKILSDTKELQKEINNLTGKLDRTFAVTDELVFKDAKKDESVRKSYKYLAALHENCSQLIQTIEDTGTILREIRDLEEQIETESGNKTVANLERILADYKAVREENSALGSKVREG
uniref:Coiled-coil domain-containing protein 22 n=1 Tax=Gadus morhua TaxID=8049 RepID=A0A8C5CKP3_GADMO